MLVNVDFSDPRQRINVEDPRIFGCNVYSPKSIHSIVAKAASEEILTGVINRDRRLVPIIQQLR